jgi:multiple sugar transport system ATP-binding protein
VLQQVGTPQHLYDAPANLFVAAFIGSPQMNLLDGVLHLDGDPHLTIADQRLDVPASVLSERPALRGHDGQEVVIGIRPEALEDAAIVGETSGHRTIEATVELREGLGSEVVAHARVDAKAPAVVGAQSDDPVLSEEGGVELVARLDPKTTVAMAATARFAVELETMHFFDPATGLAIVGAP